MARCFLFSAAALCALSLMIAVLPSSVVRAVTHEEASENYDEVMLRNGCTKNEQGGWDCPEQDSEDEDESEDEDYEDDEVDESETNIGDIITYWHEDEWYQGEVMDYDAEEDMHLIKDSKTGESDWVDLNEEDDEDEDETAEEL